MNRVIFFDTETTGLPKNKKITAIDSSNNWPDLVSICWMIYEGDRHIRTEDYIIKPSNWEIDATEIHGITDEIAHKKGKQLGDVLSLFLHDLARCKFVIAHNLNFDKNVIFNACKWRLHIDPIPFWKASEFCTAEHGKEEMKIPNLFDKNRGYRYPKLDELYFDTFNILAPENSHNAKRDVDVLKQIVLKRWYNIFV